MLLAPRIPLRRSTRYRSPYSAGGERCDDGYFGPGSVAWKVFLSPTLIPATGWSGVMFALDPAMAIIGEQSETFNDPLGRARRSLDWGYMTMLGDTRHADRAAKRVNAMHERVRGEWPVTGREYCAAEPENLLWFLMTQGQGMLTAYDAYMPRALTPEEHDRFWIEYVAQSTLNRIPEEMAPKNQAEADAYFAAKRPHLAVVEAGQRVIGASFPPPWGGELSPFPVNLPVRAAGEMILAILPDYALKLIGHERPALVKKATIVAHRPLFAALSTPGVRDIVPWLVSEQSRALLRQARASEHESRAGGLPSAPKVRAA